MLEHNFKLAAGVNTSRMFNVAFGYSDRHDSGKIVEDQNYGTL